MLSHAFAAICVYSKLTTARLLLSAVSFFLLNFISWHLIYLPHIDNLSFIEIGTALVNYNQDLTKARTQKHFV